MAATWIAFDDIPSARLRIPTFTVPRNSQPYERLHSPDDNERVQSRHGLLTSDSAPPSATTVGFRDQNRKKLRFSLFNGAFWRQTWRDARSFPWKRIGRRCLSGPIPAALILGLLVPVIIMSWFPWLVISYEVGGCSPDGEFLFDMESSGYTPWTRSSAFAVNIKFGTFTFGTAKLIDVFWDVVCHAFPCTCLRSDNETGSWARWSSYTCFDSIQGLHQSPPAYHGGIARTLSHL